VDLDGASALVVGGFGEATGVPNPKRMGRADEYAQLAMSIVDNDYLNGEVIRIDGALRFNI
jgi:hypothetical protein